MIRLKVQAGSQHARLQQRHLTLSGFRIPALTTRRAETDVELRDGQTFAIAGLHGQHVAERRGAIPLLSRLPIIGALFKSKSNRAEQTELMVLITPRLVRPLDPDEVPPLPTDPGAVHRQAASAEAAGVSDSWKVAPASWTRPNPAPAVTVKQ